MTNVCFRKRNKNGIISDLQIDFYIPIVHYCYFISACTFILSKAKSSVRLSYHHTAEEKENH